MKHKILIADDSLTIQKVIKITLASEPFELFECTEASTLNDKLDEVQPHIVLLDFNLSEDKTGYDLSKEIKAKLPNAKILMLFGTFDTIDESLLDHSGTNHKIVKPFDGTKFINLCRVMAQDLDTENAESINDTEDDFSTDTPVVEEVAMPEVIEETQETEEIEEDEWVMDSPHVDEEPEIEVEQTAPTPSSNPLVDNMKDWGMDVPGVIGGPSDHVEIPDIIAAADQVSVEMPEPIKQEPVQAEEPVTPQAMDDGSVLPSNDDLAFPDEDDLAYPDMGDTTLPDSSDLEYPDEISTDDIQLETKEEPKTEKKKPALVPIEDVDEPVIEVEASEGGTDSPEALESLRAQIEDELEEDDLWGADAYEEADTTPEDNIEEEVQTEDQNDSFDPIEPVETVAIDDLPQVEPHSLHEVKEEIAIETETDFSSFEDEPISEGTPEDFPADVMDEEPQFSASTRPQAQPQAQAQNFEVPADLEERLKEKLAPVVEDFVKEYCRENIEKIAWEVIPDLAENLIKKEIQKISDSILNS